jgi:hypothetical protein
VQRSTGYPDTGIVNVQPSVISCSPTRLDFGVVTQTSTTLPIICTNVAMQPWSFGSLTSTSGAFSATLRAGSPDRLSPGDSAVIDVSYQPTATENDTGTLTISVNQDDASVTVTMIGRCESSCSSSDGG